MVTPSSYSGLSLELVVSVSGLQPGGAGRGAARCRTPQNRKGGRAAGSRGDGVSVSRHRSARVMRQNSRGGSGVFARRWMTPNFSQCFYFSIFSRHGFGRFRVIDSPIPAGGNTALPLGCAGWPAPYRGTAARPGRGGSMFSARSRTSLLGSWDCCPFPGGWGLGPVQSGPGRASAEFIHPAAPTRTSGSVSTFVGGAGRRARE